MPSLPYPVRIESLAASERPKYWYEYTVTGRGRFPIDMLRHDRCWPATGEDAWKLGPLGRVDERHERTVRINSYQEPRIGRWESFGWKVIDRVGPIKPVWGSQEWAETYGDDLGESPDY